MPLIQDGGGGPGGGGGTSEHRRSLAEFIGLDTMFLEHTPLQPRIKHRDQNGNMNGGVESEWLWEQDQPSSPELAQSPRALVPPACFPPRHSRDFASFSENARPGQSWAEDTSSPSGQGINDLVASLKSLSMPEREAARHRVQSYSQTIHLHLTCNNNVESGLGTDLTNSIEGGVSERAPARVLPRRASFCGVVSPGTNGGKEAPRWEGTLPPRCPDPSSGYSPKLFMGGLPWDITEQALMHTLRQFHPVRVEWPEREGGGGGGGSPRGFAYVTFESERRVRELLAACRRKGHDWYYRVHSRKMTSKDAQVIPWCVSESSWVGCGSARLEPQRTVFVGALHGMLSAAALARIMDDLFTGVVYAGIDTDKNKYPIGSGRVTFNNVRSYVRAISAGYVRIHTDKFTKKVQVLPYLEDSMCSVCNIQQGPYFCREPTCYRYFCRSCWTWQHPNDEHKPLMRNSKSQPQFPHVTSSAAHVHHNGTRHHSPPADHGTHFNGNMDGTPSPPMSGSSYEPVTGSSSEEPDLPPPWSSMQ